MNLIIILISILLDGIIPHFTLFNFNNITYLTSMCTSISLIFLFNSKHFYKYLYFIIIFYGGIYINNMLLSAILFVVVSIFLYIFKHFFKDNFLNIIIQILLVIFLWDFVFFIYNTLIYKNIFIWNNYFYKVIHSIVFNLIYGIILFKLFRTSSK